jgi:hypothetical protein
MRIALVVLSGGCYAALPPPSPPQFHGEVVVSGGTLGTLQIVPRVGMPVDDDKLDLVDPREPTHALRMVRATAPSEPKPRGIVEDVTSRGVELRFADVVLDHTRCSKLDAIFRFAHGHAFGSARFDCNLGAPGRITGDVEFAAGAISAIRSMSGRLATSDSTLEGVTFAPDEAETDPDGVVFWDHHHPRVVFELGAQSLRVISTAEHVASFELARDACHTLDLNRHESGFVRVGTHQHTTWSGTIAIDCTMPRGGRLTASLELP